MEEIENEISFGDIMANAREFARSFGGSCSYEQYVALNLLNDEGGQIDRYLFRIRSPDDDELKMIKVPDVRASSVKGKIANEILLKSQLDKAYEKRHEKLLIRYEKLTTTAAEMNYPDVDKHLQSQVIFIDDLVKYINHLVFYSNQEIGKFWWYVKKKKGYKPKRLILKTKSNDLLKLHNPKWILGFPEQPDLQKRGFIEIKSLPRTLKTYIHDRLYTKRAEEHIDVSKLTESERETLSKEINENIMIWSS